jgi:hypothetical protein
MLQTDFIVPPEFSCYCFERPFNAYLEASFVKTVGIFAQEAISALEVAYKVKPGANTS